MMNLLMVAVITYCLVSDGSYLETDRAFGSAVLNVEGSGSAPDPGDGVARMVFDQFDVRIPEQERNGIFVATHVVGYKQQQRVDRRGEPMQCIDISSQCPCEENEITPNGRATGGCIASKCEIRGWCTANPAQSDGEVNDDNLQEKYSAVIDNVDMMLITMQIAVEFPLFGIAKTVDLHRRKLGYNVWRIGDILKGVGEEYESIKEDGIIIVR